MMKNITDIANGEQGGKARNVYGLFILFSPLYVLPVLVILTPILWEGLYREYTGIRYNTYFTKSLVEGSPISLDVAAAWLRRYFFRFMVESVVRYWNSIGPGLLMGGAMTVGALFLYWTTKHGSFSFKTRLLFQGILLSAFSLFLFLKSISLPNVFWFTLIVYLVIGFNFLWVQHHEPYRQHGFFRGIRGAVIVLSGGLAHVFAAAQIAGLAVESLFPGNHKVFRKALISGQLITCLISFPLLGVLFSSTIPTPEWSQAKLLMKDPELYDIQIDRTSNQLLVSQKLAWYKKPCHAFNLSNPMQQPRSFLIPSYEVEDFILDASSQKIFHIDRGGEGLYPARLIILDSPSLDVTKEILISAKITGTPKLAYSKESECLFVSSEDGGWIHEIKASDGAVVNRIHMKSNPIICLDETNRVLYVKPGYSSRILALDMYSLAIKHETAAPGSDFRMLLSPKHEKLYIPDPTGSSIWVYSTPNLKLLRKIDSQFGVRALASDDHANLLFALSYITGYLEIIDIESGELLEKHYIGKFCRKMVWDGINHRGYITLFKKGLVMFTHYPPFQPSNTHKYTMLY
ncbi:MAG: hypothetical protein JEZ02_01005 [Desulfatibacillum sp.]|nr:hypothetical protein [Desulfatibacillum sp.]